MTHTLADHTAAHHNTKDLLGRALRDLRISVTDQCQFRCPHCMPADKITQDSFIDPKDQLTDHEIVSIVRLLSTLGLQKVRLTGGEPLLRKNIDCLIEQLKSFPSIDDVALTTNGLLLEDQACNLKRSGLDRLTVSLNTLDQEIFEQMSGTKYPVSRILRGISAAAQAGFRPIKINVVIKRNVNSDHILDLVDFFHHTQHIVRFIEFMDVGTQNNWRAEEVVASTDIYAMIQKKFPCEALEPNYPGEVAKRYRFKDGQGEIGFISSISQPFCRDCSRLRLSPGGIIYGCLFACEGLDLMAWLRPKIQDKEILGKIQDYWRQRWDCYSEKRFLVPDPNTLAKKRIEMYQIGG